MSDHRAIEDNTNKIVKLDVRVTKVETDIWANSRKIETIDEGIDASRDNQHVSNTYLKNVEKKVDAIEAKLKEIENNGFLNLTKNIKKGDIFKILIPLIAILFGSDVITINLTQEANQEILDSIKTLTD